MKVKFKQNIASIYGGFAVGEEAEIPAEAAKDYIAAGYAEAVKAPVKKAREKQPEPVEEVED